MCASGFAARVHFVLKALAGSDAAALVDCDVEEAIVFMRTQTKQRHSFAQECASKHGHEWINMQGRSQDQEIREQQKDAGNKTLRKCRFPYHIV